MHGSQLLFWYWFIAIHLLTSMKKSFSAKELQRQLGHSNYDPIWAMLHNLRQVMCLRDSCYSLGKVVELDEGFFSTATQKEDKNQPLKRGRGSQKKSKVLVMTESIPTEDDTTTPKGKSRKVGHIKMFVIDDLRSETIDKKVIQYFDRPSVIDSDNSTSYTNFKTLVKEQRPQVIPKKEVSTLLPWVHIAIGNAKRMLLDIVHDIKPEYLQNYLNEFCYKFIRRYFGETLFDRLVVAAVA